MNNIFKIVEELNKDPGSFYDQHIKPYETLNTGSFYDKHIKPYEHDAGSNVKVDNFETPEDDKKDSKYFTMFDPEVKTDELKPDPITGDYDYSNIQPDLVEEIVKNLEGYKYDVKQDGNTIIIIFDQKIGSDLVKKWAKVFPENKYKGIPIEIEVKQ